MKKKVLFVIDTLNTGGAEKSILEIASRFGEYEAVVCHIYPGDTLRGLYERAGIQVVSLEVPGHYNFVLALKKLQKVVCDLNPVIIHSTLFRSDIITRTLKGMNGIPLVNSLVNNSYHESRFVNVGVYMKLKLMTVRLIDALTAVKVDLFISNSEAIRLTNSKKLKINPSRIVVIYRGRNPRDFDDIESSDTIRLRRELGLENRPTLLNVSRLLDRKGQLDLVKAIKNVSLKIPRLKVLVAGDGPFRATLVKAITDLQLEENIELLGTRHDIPQLLKAADAFVFPSYYEGLPGALIEAMMAATPIIASSIPENLECVDSESAFLFAPGNILDLEARICQCLVDRDLSSDYAKKAYRIAKEKFNIESISRSYELAYDQLLGV